MRSFEEIGTAIGQLVAEKNKAYGSSFSKSGAIMRILYPKGIPVEALDDALTIVRVLDKLFRIATARDALGENPWQDIMGYALLSVHEMEVLKTSISPLRHCSDCGEELQMGRLKTCTMCQPG